MPHDHVRLRVESLPDRTTKGELLAWLCRQGEIDGKQVGRIELLGRIATVEVPASAGARLVRRLDGSALRERKVSARLEGTGNGADDHFARLARLLALEARAEEAEAADPDAECPLTGLTVRDEEPALGGRVALTLGPPNPSQPLPWFRMSGGAPVLLRGNDQPPTVVRGVLAERTDKIVRVVADVPEDGLPDDARWALLPGGDATSRQRQEAALLRARSAGRDERLAELRDVLLGDREPAEKPPADEREVSPALNESQRQAVAFALAAPDLAILHGPPGTGKTTAVAELIRLAVARGEKVLACAPSNLGVDNLLERLLAAGLDVVRLGHPARVLPGLLDSTLDAQAAAHPDARLARKLAKEARDLFRRAGKWTRSKPAPGEKQALRSDGRRLMADARRLERQAAESVIARAAVVGATLTGLDAETLGQRTFDLAVIDEACQSAEPASWVPVLRAKRIVLAGDHCQLPPTVLSREAQAGGLAVSLMERVVARFGPTVTRRLQVQYRMHAAIAAFSSEEFYESDLIPDPTVAGHLLRDLPGVAATPLTESAARFIDTAGAGYDEEAEPGTSSRRNPREAALAAAKVSELLAAGVRPRDVAVITPYSGQVRWLRERLDPAIEVDSVDGFQGREKEAVIVSLVRSNPEGEVGFLSDVRRTNVAMTRARRLLVVIGDSATLGAEPFYARMLAHFEAAGAYGSVWEEGA
jgi:hypothetical protein